MGNKEARWDWTYITEERFNACMLMRRILAWHPVSEWPTVMQTSTITATHAGRAMYDLSLPGTTLLESGYFGDRCEYDVVQAIYNA